jgi:5-methyltetrahydrofolate--homocysteine methyltransferase
MDRVVAGEAEALWAEQQAEGDRRRAMKAAAVKPSRVDVPEKSDVPTDNPVPLPPFWGRREVASFPPEQLFPYVNETALFTGQWGFKRKGMDEAAYERLLDEKARPVFEALKRRAVAEKLLSPKVVYGYFPVQSSGDDLIVYHTEEFLSCVCHGQGAPGRCKPSGPPREWLRFNFPRQDTRRRLCVADFFRPVESGEYDVLGVQLVTVGDRASEISQELFAQNKYQDYLYLHGFGVECAEALAELWHKRMRQELGFGSDDAPLIRELFQQGYRGSRYSFGYPACPDLSERAKVLQLLRPEAIGVTLTENFMLVPEQSTDALVAHHPLAKYFDVKPAEAAQA